MLVMGVGVVCSDQRYVWLCVHRFLGGRVYKIGLNMRVHCVQELDVFNVRLEAHF